MNMRIITSVAMAAGLALSLSACAKKDATPQPTDATPAPAGPAHNDGPPGAEQQK